VYVKGNTAMHQALADRIRSDILAAQRVYREDPSLDMSGVEKELRFAYARVADRIAWLRCSPGPAQPEHLSILRQLQAKRARYSKPRRRWGLARIFGGLG